MGHTPQDSESIIKRQKEEIAYLTSRITELSNWRGTMAKAADHAKGMFDEAIALAARAESTMNMSDPKSSKRLAELQRLGAYFREGKRNFEDALAGFPTEVAEKPSLE